MKIIYYWLMVVKKHVVSYLLILLSELRLRRNDLPGAMDALRQALDERADLGLPVFSRLEGSLQKLQLNDDEKQYLKSEKAKLISFLEQKDYKTTIELANRLSQAFPLNFEVQEFVGELHEKCGEHSKSNTYFATAIILSSNYQETRRLDLLLKNIPFDESLVITQVANNYFPIFELWYRHFASLGLANLLVICLDPVVYKRIRNLGIAAYHLPIFSYQSSIRTTLWYQTVKFRQRLNGIGVNYLHSDVDAFWLRNPLELIERQSGDIVSSIAFGVPPEVVKAWGFTMCLGFYMIRSSAETRGMYSDFVKYTKKDVHDQNGFNRLMLNRGVEWNYRAEGIITGWSENLGLKITVLPDEYISRKDEIFYLANKNLHVFHPLLEGKDVTGKLAQIEKYNLQRLG